MSRRNRGDSTDGLEPLPEGEAGAVGFPVGDEPQPSDSPVGPAGEVPPQQAPPAPSDEAPAVEETELPKRYVVAPGRSLTVRRGHLGEGAVVRPADLSAEQVAELVKSGHLLVAK